MLKWQQKNAMKKKKIMFKHFIKCFSFYQNEFKNKSKMPQNKKNIMSFYFN